MPSYLDRRNDETNIQMGPSGTLLIFFILIFSIFTLLSLSLSLDVEDDKGTLKPRMESKEVTGGLTTLVKAMSIHKHSC